MCGVIQPILSKVFHKQTFEKLLKTLSLDTIETIQAAVQKMEIEMEKSGFMSLEFSLNYFVIIIDFLDYMCYNIKKESQLQLALF